MPSIDGKVKITTNLAPLKRLMKKSPGAFLKAMEIGAIQFLTWANNGSAREGRKPPIRWGVLRGSSSAFVGSKLVSISHAPILAGATESPTPAQSHAAENTLMTWVWNTDYAAKMHEWKGGWGKFTTQDGDAGNKWIEKHLMKDRNDLMKVIGMEFKRETGI